MAEITKRNIKLHLRINGWGVKQMKICEKCSEVFPGRTKINGKTKTLYNRKFCLKCSPWGEHNTKSKLVNVLTKEENDNLPCSCCGKLNKKKRGYTKCHSCFFSDRRNRVLTKILDIVGRNCWLCHYSKCDKAIDFHHVDPKTKVFPINANTSANIKWNDIFLEMKKCVRLCCRCHREYHSGMIEDKIILDLHKNKWFEIQKNEQVQKIDLPA